MNDLKNAASGWVKNLTSEIKSALGIGTQRDVMRNEVGKYLATSVAKGLAENDKAVVKQFSAMLKKLDYQRDFDIINEGEYYAQLEQLRDRYFVKGTENWVKYTQKIYAYQGKLLEAEKKALEQEKKEIAGIYDEITDYAIERLNEVIKKQQKAKEELSNSGSLYNLNTVQMNGFTDTYYSLHNLEADIANIERYGNILKGVKERLSASGADEEASKAFFESFNSLDMQEVIGLGGALLNANDEKFRAYIGAWNKKQLLSEDIAYKRYAEEFEESTKAAYDNMQKKLSAAGYEIPDEFFRSGSISAEKFGDAFVSGLDEQLIRIQNKIEEFNKSLALGINPSYGNIYNTTNTSYNISAQGGDTVEQIRRYETVKRLAGVN